MGRYFGLANSTKRHCISHYWKNAPPSIKELKQIAIIFGWDLNKDVIKTGSYCDAYVYDSKNENWGSNQFDRIMNEEIDDTMNEEMDDKNHEENNNEKEMINCGFNPEHDMSKPQDVAANIIEYQKCFDSTYCFN